MSAVRSKPGSPRLAGKPIIVSLGGSLTAWRGKLLSGVPYGQPVHAGSFIRRRRIVLDAELARRPRDLRRILAHELCHFAWLRLGNPLRRSWEDLLAGEMRRHAKGELGWSAESRKQGLAPRDAGLRTRRWREYASESFCDTGAWLYMRAPHAEHTLAGTFRLARRRWFERAHLLEQIPV